MKFRSPQTIFYFLLLLTINGTAEIYSGKYLDERKRILILAASDAESAVQLIVNSTKK